MSVAAGEPLGSPRGSACSDGGESMVSESPLASWQKARGICLFFHGGPVINFMPVSMRGIGIASLCLQTLLVIYYILWLRSRARSSYHLEMQ